MNPLFMLFAVIVLNFLLIGPVLAGEELFDHALYAKVLAGYVKDGSVDYRALQKDHLYLDAYAGKAAELDPQLFVTMGEKEKLAFYINVYNALTLKVITENYPVKSIKDIPGVWDEITFRVAGRELSLNQIEHEILRKEFKEPRIHFALVCASKGCPKLADEPFNGRDLDTQLDREARKFINDRTKVVLDKDSRILYLSSIFKWFKKDFGDVTEFAGGYLPVEAVQFIKENKPGVKYLDYDWSLNEKD